METISKLNDPRHNQYFVHIISKLDAVLELDIYKILVVLPKCPPLWQPVNAVGLLSTFI